MKGKVGGKYATNEVPKKGREKPNNNERMPMNHIYLPKQGKEREDGGIERMQCDRASNIFYYNVITAQI